MRFRLSLSAAAFAAASLFAPTATAQVPFIPQFGVLGGVNFGSLSDARTADLDNATGFHVGAFAELGLGPIGVRPAVMFVKAGTIEAPTADFAGLRDLSTSYIAVPVDVRYSPLPTPVIKPYLLAGPEVRLPVGDLASDDVLQARSVAVAANVGVGAKIGALIGPTFFGEIRYAFDISGLVEDREIELPGGATVDSDGTYGLNGLFVTVGVGL